MKCQRSVDNCKMHMTKLKEKMENGRRLKWELGFTPSISVGLYLLELTINISLNLESLLDDLRNRTAISHGDTAHIPSYANVS